MGSCKNECLNAQVHIALHDSRRNLTPDLPHPCDFSARCARKSASLKCQYFYCIFGRFRGGLLFTVFYFLTNLKNILILLHKNCWIPKNATFFGFCALRNLQKLGRKGGSKSATFARNRKIWTHWSNIFS